MRAARYSRRQMRSGPLVLVNRQHPLAEEPRQLLTAADERYPNILLERQAARLLAACIQAAGGAREIVPVSGWRSQAEQQAIWEDTLQRRGEAFTRQYVAVPGCSEHQTGLAIDLGRAARGDRLHPARFSGGRRLRAVPATGAPVWLHPAVPPGKGVPDRYRL